MFGFFRKRQQAADFLRAAGEAEPERQIEVALLRGCRDLFGPPPRSLSALVTDRVVLPPDLEEVFVASKDGLLRILKDQDRLLARGQVYWGHLVQANQILFHRRTSFTVPTPSSRGACPSCPAWPAVYLPRRDLPEPTGNSKGSSMLSRTK